MKFSLTRYINHERERKFYHICKPWEELKIRCAKEFFWRHARCLKSLWNFVFSARINSSMQTETKKNNREVTLRSTCADKFIIAVIVMRPLVKFWQLLKKKKKKKIEVTVQQRFISKSEIQTDIIETTQAWKRLVCFSVKVPITPKYFFHLNKSLHLFGTHCTFLPLFNPNIDLLQAEKVTKSGHHLSHNRASKGYGSTPCLTSQTSLHAFLQRLNTQVN